MPADPNQPILDQAALAVGRAQRGRHGRSLVLLGPDGAERSAVLEQMAKAAEAEGGVVLRLDGAAPGPLAGQISPKLQSIVQGWSAEPAARVLAGFRRAHKLTEPGETISTAMTEPGIADTGLIEHDLPDLLAATGKAAKAANQPLALCVDNMQALSKPDLTALLMAVHRTNQQALPVVLFGAGPSSMPGLAGNARSYAERMLDFPAMAGTNSPAAAKPQPALKTPGKRPG
jgi:hypothetical protein